MIKNEYMKLSRDASHRRLKSDPDVLDGNGVIGIGVPAAEEDSKKVCTAVWWCVCVPVFRLPGRSMPSSPPNRLLVYSSAAYCSAVPSPTAL